MQDTENLNEELLDAWLKLSISVSNERMDSEMPYNEALICNILYWNHKKYPDRLLTATDLCRETKMLKSQMNRTLNNMEEKKLIRRERSNRDRRHVFITLNLEESDIYKKQHAKILHLIDTVIEKFGKEKTMEIISTLKIISDVAKEIM